MDIKLMAEVYRLGISIGLFTIQEVIKWADKVIEQLEAPPYEIIDLSLSSKETLEAITLKLMMVKGECDYDLPPKIILGLLSEHLNDIEDMATVINRMDKLLEHLPACCEEVEMQIHFLSDGFYLAEQKISGELEEVYSSLLQFLDSFKCYGGIFSSEDI